MLSSVYHTVAAMVRRARELHLHLAQGKDRVGGLLELSLQRTAALGQGLETLGALSRAIVDAEAEAERTARLAASTAEGLSGTREAIDGLARAAERIEEVLERVKAVAEQTRLLALNATIEAARAGEHGKGFAVVASEVKDLSDESASAAEQIVEEVGSIRSAVETSRSGLDGVSTSFEALERACAAIAETMQDQTRTVGDVERDLGQVARGVQATVDAMHAIQAGVDDELTRAAELEQEATRLHATLDRDAPSAA